MNQYEQYQKFYRMLRQGHKTTAMWEFANQFSMLSVYEKALGSYRARNRRPKTLAERLERYKSRKFVNSSMAYAA